MIRKIGAASLAKLLGGVRHVQAGEPAFRRLASGVRLLVLDGRLPPETRLPSERDLAESLALSRNTIAAAFAELRADGFLASRRGSGSIATLPARRIAPAAAELDFSVAALPAGPAIHKAYVAALADLPSYLPGNGYDPLGVGPAREAVAARYAARGLPTTAEQVMMTNGALAALSLLLRLMTSPGDRVLIDHPTYPLAIAAIRGASCRPVPVMLPAAGWDIVGLAAAIAQTSPRLAYLLPDHHNPTGRCMDRQTRGAIAELAARTRTTIVVDETMADLWYEAPPPAPLAAFDAAADVVTIGSAAKSFWGGLRVGWIRASARTIGALSRARDAVDLGTPILEQLAVAHLLDGADAELPSRRAALRERRDALVEAGSALLPDWHIPPPQGGLSCWMELPLPAASRLAERAASGGLRIGAGPNFGLDGAFERFLRMPFTLEADATRAALQRLASLWQGLDFKPDRWRIG